MVDLRAKAREFEAEWRAALDKQAKDIELSEALTFLAGQQVVAEAISGLLGDADTGVDAVIGFVASGGLGKDGKTAMLALREYREMLPTWKAGDDAVEWNLAFYKRLADVGIAV